MESCGFSRGQGPCDTHTAKDTKATSNHDLDLPIIRWTGFPWLPNVDGPVVWEDTDGASGPRVCLHYDCTVSLGGGYVGTVVCGDQRHPELFLALQYGIDLCPQDYCFGFFPLMTRDIDQYKRVKVWMKKFNQFLIIPSFTSYLSTCTLIH